MRFSIFLLSVVLFQEDRGVCALSYATNTCSLLSCAGPLSCQKEPTEGPHLCRRSVNLMRNQADCGVCEEVAAAQAGISHDCNAVLLTQGPQLPLRIPRVHLNLHHRWRLTELSESHTLAKARFPKCSVQHRASSQRVDHRQGALGLAHVLRQQTGWATQQAHLIHHGLHGSAGQQFLQMVLLIVADANGSAAPRLVEALQHAPRLQALDGVAP